VPCRVAGCSHTRWEATSWPFVVAPIAEGKDWWTDPVGILHHPLLMALHIYRRRWATSLATSLDGATSGAFVHISQETLLRLLAQKVCDVS